MLLLLDALFTNAVYNAPVAGGLRLNAQRSRSEAVESPKPVSLRWASDKERVVLAVRDEYGSLAPDAVLSSLRRTHGADQPAPEGKQGGAGLGFYFLLQTANRLVINIEPGVFTEIIVARRLQERRREFMNNPPTLNLCAPQSAASARRWERSAVKWAAVYLGDGAPQPGTLLDVCPGGCFIRPETANEPPKVGSQIEITFPSDAGQLPMVMRGLVTWSGYSRQHACHGFGVEFAQPGHGA